MGICRIDTALGTQPSGSRPSACARTHALLVRRESGSGFSLLFRAAEMSAALTRQYFFQRTHFEVSEPCPLSPALLSAAQLIGCSHIWPGRYPIYQGGGFYRIDF